MKKILVYCWYYPPINSSEGIVTFKLINNSKYQFDVFAQNKDQNWSYGNTFTFENKDNVRVITAESDNINDYVKEGIEYFDKHHNEYDAVMTRITPQEVHLIGIEIKKKYPNIKFIASYGDPISTNPYYYLGGYFYSFNSTKNLVNRNKGLKWKLNPIRILKMIRWNIRAKDIKAVMDKARYVEETSEKYADALIFNNESQIRWMVKDRNLLKKSYLLYHSYDLSMYGPKPEKNKKLVFSFIGHLDATRTPLPLFKAIKLLNDSVDGLSDKVVFDFYGDMDENAMNYVKENELGNIIFNRDPVSYVRSLEIMQQSDWLIHIDADISAVSDENVFFAAKIADYFGSGTPIIAITMKNGAVVDALKNAGEVVLGYDENEIKNCLYSIVEKGYTVSQNAEYISKYDAKNVAAAFDKMVEEIM